jgi:S-DNA-T family DNA segregation ATPase FtsK/SpoIIIE
MKDPALLAAYFGNSSSRLAQRNDWTEAALGVDASSTMAIALAESMGEQKGGGADVTVVIIEGVGDFLNSDADGPLQALLKACRSAGVFVVAEGDISELGGARPLLQALRAGRHGIVLQPDQSDGDLLFKTSFPRIKRSDFPVGRGMYVRQGRVQRVQVALPE